MLEPLVALTVLNCFFMFSSSITTCALWWQYRSHRCCFTRTSPGQSSKTDPRKPKSSCTCPIFSKAAEKSRGNRAGIGETATNVEQKKKKKKLLRKARTEPRHRVQYKGQSNETVSASTETARTTKDDEVKTIITESSQTVQDTKAPMVMEISTVRKVVHIIDDDTGDLSKFPMKDLVLKGDMME